MLASDPWTLQSAWPYSPTQKDASLPSTVSDSRSLASFGIRHASGESDSGLVAEELLKVDGRHLRIDIRPDRIALPNSLDLQNHRDWLESFHAQVIRPINDVYTLYEVSGNYWAQRTSDPFMQIAQSIPVLQVQGASTDAILLDELVVQLKPGVEPMEFFRHDTRIESWRPLPGTDNQFVLKVTALGLSTLSIANDLSEDPKIAWASPNFYQDWQRYYTPNDARLNNQWYVSNLGQSDGQIDADLDLLEAWDINAGGSDHITIAVVDDGVAINHPDLLPWTNNGEIANNGLDDDGNGWVDDVYGWNFVNNSNQSFPTSHVDRHGTVVAGLAAAKGDNSIGIAGAAYRSRIMSVRIFDSGIPTSDANIASALYYAAGRTATGTGTWKSADVINNSWGGGAPSALINAALAWGTTFGRQGEGAPFFFAAGNESNQVSEPASQSLHIPGVIAVGAMNHRGTLSDYSNFGAAVDFVVPSDDLREGYLGIDSTDRVGPDGYNAADYLGIEPTSFGGTSAAAGLASGVAALVLAQAESIDKPLSPYQLQKLLRNTTDLIEFDDATFDTTTGRDARYGFGRLNAANALKGLGQPEIALVSTNREWDNNAAYDFGAARLGESVDVTFRIRNQGTSLLTLEQPIVSAGAFTLLSGITRNTIGLGGSTSFTVRMTSESLGDFQGSLSIVSNDSNEPSFVLPLRVSVLDIAIGGAVFEDWNGNGLRDPMDHSAMAAQAVYIDANDNGAFDANLNQLQITQSNPRSIADLSVVSSSLIVAGLSNYITDINVRLTAEHSMASDLSIRLVSPSGKSVLLFDRHGQRQHDFVDFTFDDQAETTLQDATLSTTWTGRIAPWETLGAYDGENANGEWRLFIDDQRPVDQGQLLEWSIELTTGERVARTQANGYFHFDELPVGAHVLRPIIPDGYASVGATSHIVLIQGPNDAFTQRHFGMGKTNRFYGSVYNDVDNDGTQDLGERGLPHWEAFWDQNQNGNLDTESSWLVTSGSLQATIPDQTTRSFDMLVAGGIGTLDDVDVAINIGMTFDADLRVILIHPDGTRIELFTNVGGSRNDFQQTVLDDSAPTSILQSVAPYTGSFRPEGELSALNGKLTSGIWKLEITDVAADFEAILQDWELRLIASEKVMPSNSFGAFAFDLPESSSTSIRLIGQSGWSYTVPAQGMRTVSPNGMPMFDQYYGVKAPPAIAVEQLSVSGTEGVSIINSGTWSDQDSFAEDIVLEASLGSVVKHLDGHWLWSYTAPDQRSLETVTVTASDSLGNSHSVSFLLSIVNASPTLTRSAAVLTGNVLSTFLNTGAYGDVSADTVSIVSTVGTVVRNTNGTWNWSYVPSSRLVQQTVLLTATDEDGGSTTIDFTIDALVALSRVHSYYRDSEFQNLGGINAALETNKQFLRPSSQIQSTGQPNVINYSRGLNGIILDVAGLVSNSLTNSDFVFRISPSRISGTVMPANWGLAPSPQSISVLPGTATTAARIVLNWPNNTIQNNWLQIIVKSNENTGLVEREVFYIGHAMGEMNGGTPYRVTTAELSMVQAGISNSIRLVTDIRDVNKDRRVTTFDLSFIQSRISNTVLLQDINIPPKNSVAEGESVEFCVALDVASSIVFSINDLSPDVLLYPIPGPSSKTTPQTIDTPDDGSLRYDEEGLAYFYDPDHFAIDELSIDGFSLSPTKIGGVGLPTLQEDPQPLTVPAYHSNPSYSKKIYLDFDGESISGTTWNNRNYTGAYNTGSLINAPAFSLDSDRTNFSSAELNAIYDTWVRVAEDFAPFQVDVTTESPPSALFTAGSQAIRVMVSTDFDATNNTQWYPNAGGVAYLNSWNWTNGSPVWVFTNRLGGSSKNFAEASTHEVGHSFGLSHDGRSSPVESYYTGHGSGATGWAPIMGVGYSRSLTQWSKGEYTNANNTEDDLLRISNALGYIPDDHGNSSTTSTQLTVGTNGAIANGGLIETRSDIDVYRFATQSGNVVLQANPIDVTTSRGNLDVSITLRESNGTEIVTVNSVDAIGTTLNRSLLKGFYTLSVEGVGRASITGNEGYSDYASIGQYTLSGSVVPNQSPIAVHDNLLSGPVTTMVIDVLANDSDINSDEISILSIGTPNVGTAFVESGRIRFNPPSQFFGQIVIPYTIADELGATATASATIQIIPNETPVITANLAIVSGNEGSIIANQGTWSDADLPANTITLTASVGSVTKNDNGTWSWQISTSDQVASTNVTITANDGLGGIANASFVYSAQNQPPSLTVSLNAVTGDVLTGLINAGSWSDVLIDNVSLSASIGTVTRNIDGTWSWIIVPSTKLANQTVTITATDKEGASNSVSFTIDALVAIPFQRVYYRDSEHESLFGSDAAIDMTKSMLASSNVAMTTSSANVVNYVRGINGLVLDIAGLVSTNLTADDFQFRTAPAGTFGAVTPSEWPSAPTPSDIRVLPGTVTSPARVYIDWVNSSIQNTWLQITVLANSRTGLAKRQVYYIGHALGDVAGGTPYRVTTLDLSEVQEAISTSLVLASNPRDFNRDRRVTTFDLSFVQSLIANTVLLQDIIIPAAESAAEGESQHEQLANNPVPSVVNVDQLFGSRLQLDGLLSALHT